ncbi:MAG: xanthine dehydrogenase small subunit [Betaproteobacteria bacterium]
MLDGGVREIRDTAPTRSVLQYLREDLGRSGTKEGCAEGDCGACTVVLVEADGDRLRCRAVNACIQFVPTLDGKALFTVESLRRADGSLHPVQQAMVDCHGSQCGFCTPGFVMSMFALYKNNAAPSRQVIDDALAGNLCRCTGYRPIVAAAGKMYELAGPAGDWAGLACGAESPAAADSEQALLAQLKSLQRSEPLVTGHAGAQLHAPQTLQQLAALRLRHPAARILAGGTDVGLWVTKQLRDIGDILYVGNVAELAQLRVSATHLDIGAAVNFSDLQPALVEHFPEMGELLRRFASPPIRNAATLGGNIANGSPIGDAMPPLIALGTKLVLRKGAVVRELELDAFYLDYQKTALAAGEFVERILIPLHNPLRQTQFRVYKLSKRGDQDISALCAAFWLVLRGGRVQAARIAFGGMAAIPKRARQCEAALLDKEWSEANATAAAQCLDQDFQPIGDMRASAAYRALAARNLLQRFYLETAGGDAITRVGQVGV